MAVIFKEVKYVFADDLACAMADYAGKVKLTNVPHSCDIELLMVEDRLSQEKHGHAFCMTECTGEWSA